MSETRVTVESWSFAATSESIKGLPRAIRESLELEADRKFSSEGDGVRRMEAASQALAHLLATELWGSGPFTVSLSGSAKSLYLAVTAK